MIKRSQKYLLPALTIVANHTPSFIWALLEFMLDIFFFWNKKVYQIYYSKDPLKEYIKQLKNVQSYNEWKRTITEIDRLTNIDLWRQNLISKHYDYILIDERTKLLKHARLNHDSPLIMSFLRGGLIRNFGGIAQKKLYMKSYMGTKFKIEEYITEILNCLNYLNDSINLQNDATNNIEYVMNSKQLTLDFFHDARQSYGSTALILQGGSLFGLCHLGVVKALYFKGLLPRIFGGSAVGAAVASLVCCLTDDELTPILISIASQMGNVDRLNHDVDERYGNVIENVVKKGYSQDILLFLKFVRDTIGDLTFEEAYLKTDKVLNIAIHPTDQSVPSLLNYITSPNVIIWTAVYASIGTGVLSDDVKLYVKDFNNQIVPQTPNIDVKFLKPQDVSYSEHYFSSHKTNSKESKHESFSDSKFNVKTKTPYTRLTELFNVNHFITSLARPYLAPLISNDLKHTSGYGRTKYHRLPKKIDDSAELTQSEGSFSFSAGEGYIKDSGFTLLKHIKNLLGMEIQHRLELMDKLGILPDTLKRFFIDEKPSHPQSLASIREITIVPELRYLLKDFGRVFDVHKTMENIPYWVLVGERSVWPLFPLLWARCSIEFALDDLYNIHRKKS